MSSKDIVVKNIPERYYTAWRISQDKSFQNLTTNGLDTKTFIIEIKLAEALSKRFFNMFNRELTEEEGVFLLHNTMKNPNALKSIINGFTKFLDENQVSFLDCLQHLPKLENK